MSNKREDPAPSAPELLPLASNIVSAYVSNNAVPGMALPELIRQVHHALLALRTGERAEASPKMPAVPVRKSVTPDYLVCLEDGKKLKMLKRHLRSVYGMTPQDYRRKWDLPSDYPMVAPNYAAQRADFARAIGLGRSPGRAKKRRAK
ncbi:MAG TPA: MucR family transcriptional regulator [Alphaproteobacteria bacterium]|jgi:predicted transcriptional regulator